MHIKQLEIYHFTQAKHERRNLTDKPKRTIANSNKILFSLIASLRSKGIVKKLPDQCFINQPKIL